MDTGDVWSRFAHDPRRAEHAHLRASDLDRDLVRDVLAEAVAEGRLTIDEHRERADRAAETRTLGEIPALVRDLVPDVPRGLSRLERLRPEQLHTEAERRYRAERRSAVQSAAVLSLLCTAVWAATGFGFFWPVFVVLALGGRAAYVAANRQDRVARIEHRLERRRARAALIRELRALPPGRRTR